MPSFLPATYSTEFRDGQWWMVVEENGEREWFPAASKVGAEVMIGLERERREGRSIRR